MAFILTFCFVLAIGGIFFAFAVQEREYVGLAFGGTLVAALITFIAFGTKAVPAGHVGIVSSFGAIVDQIEEGVHFVAPWRSVDEVSVRIVSQSFDEMSSFSKESQDVFVTATLNTQVSPDKIQTLYREVGPDYFEVLIKPRVHQAFKDETVSYTSVEIAPNREKIRKNVRAKLEAELSKHSIAVQDLLIDEIRFSELFQGAIEEKQKQTQVALAEQEKVKAERSKAEQVIESARGKAEAVLINATKQAEANKVLAESLTPEYINYIYVSKLAPNVSVMMVPTNQPFLFDTKGLASTPAPAPKTE
jgi:regulator of protease activity HflC (stomatin/prohibitin superfamily)